MRRADPSASGSTGGPRRVTFAVCAASKTAGGRRSTRASIRTARTRARGSTSTASPRRTRSSTTKKLVDFQNDVGGERYAEGFNLEVDDKDLLKGFCDSEGEPLVARAKESECRSSSSVTRAATTSSPRAPMIEADDRHGRSRTAALRPRRSPTRSCGRRKHGSRRTSRRGSGSCREAVVRGATVPAPGSGDRKSIPERLG